ncbi:MAG TPA: dihydropteroate synthase [Dehalococcoidia bacterium]|nr:dihydropteroate synthase [Dehalococcoidia bacterium]
MVAAALESQSSPAPIRIGPRVFTWSARTYVMGILNMTPDSFSGDGLALRGIEAALETARRMVEAGADMLDVGGESTRPGAEPVGAEEEMRRVVPLIEALAKALPDVPISIDTWKAEVARAALQSGAHWVNDVWGFLGDSNMANVVAEHDVPCVLMFNGRGVKVHDVLNDAKAALRRSMEAAREAGVPADRIVLDPGFGFGITAEQSLELLRRLRELRELGRPLLAGTSRKSMIGAVLGLPVEARLEGTAATVALAIANGADIVRVHDVQEMTRVARMADAIVRGWRPS